MRDPVIDALEMAMEYIQGAIMCRRVDDLSIESDTNLTRARIELDTAEAELENERYTRGSEETDNEPGG